MEESGRKEKEGGKEGRKEGSKEEVGWLAVAFGYRRNKITIFSSSDGGEEN